MRLYALLLLLCAFMSAPGAEIRSDASAGRVEEGETVRFSWVKPDDPGVAAYRVRLFVDGVEKQSEIVSVSGKKAIDVKAAHHGWFCITAEPLDIRQQSIPAKKRFGDGVLVSPQRLKPARPRPADFDSFWSNRLSILNAVPMNVKRRTVSSDDDVRVEEITLRSCGKIPVTGLLAMPKDARPGALPAILTYHGAGYKSSSIRRDFAQRAILFDVNAHGLPSNMPKRYYRDLNHGKTKNCIFYDRDDRERSYVVQLLLRAARAAQFVQTLPEWDGKTLIVFGRSQGGAQALAVAALIPEVTLCIANVPALCDHGGFAVGRRPGWPQLNCDLTASGNTAGKNRPDFVDFVECDLPQQPVTPQIKVVSDYVDIVNFAPRIRCRTCLSGGLIDFICPPTGAALVANALPAGILQEFRPFPQKGHEAPPLSEDFHTDVQKALTDTP